MSAISNFINTIRTAVYGEQVRGAIANAIEQCYDDVSSPSLQTAAFKTALEEEYADGILDIQTVTQISAMTNQNIIYRYNGTEAGKQKGLYYYSALSSSWVLIGSEIHSVSNSSLMTDTNAIYKYTGTQTGMVQNALYFHNGTSWVQIGKEVEVDNTLTQQGKPADAKATGDRLDELEDAVSQLDTAMLTDTIKGALLNCFENVAWKNSHGASYYNVLVSALDYDPGGGDDDESGIPETITEVKFQSGYTIDYVTGKKISAENRTASSIIPFETTGVAHTVVTKINGTSTTSFLRVFDKNGLIWYGNTGMTIPADNNYLAVFVVLTQYVTSETISVTVDGTEYPCVIGTVSEFSNTVPVNLKNCGIDTNTGAEVANTARALTDFIPVGKNRNNTVQLGYLNNIQMTANSGIYIKVFEYSGETFNSSYTVGALDSNTIQGYTRETVTKIRVLFKKADGSNFTQDELNSITLNNQGMVDYNFTLVS